MFARTLFVLPLLSFCFSLFVPAAQAQLLATGTIQGTATDVSSPVAIALQISETFNENDVLLFEDELLDATSVGQVFEATALTEPDLGAYVGFLTDGDPSILCAHINGRPWACTIERGLFDPAGLDYQGTDIRRVTMEVAALDFVGSDLDFTVVVSLYLDGPAISTCDELVLREPAPSALLDNGCAETGDPMIWDFSWDSCLGATEYQLQVRGPNAIVDLVDEVLTTLEYRRRGGGYVADVNRIGWTWKVRARVDGTLLDWSEGIFDVEPEGTDCTVATAAISWGALKHRY